MYPIDAFTKDDPKIELLWPPPDQPPGPSDGGHGKLHLIPFYK